MKNHPLTKLALKLAGIYILVQAVLFVPVVYPMIYISIRMLFSEFGESNPLYGAYTTSSVIVFIILLIVGLWLTFKVKLEANESPAKLYDLVQLGVIVSGVILFIAALNNVPSAVEGLVDYARSPQANANLPYFSSLTGQGGIHFIVRPIIVFVQLILGLMLFFKSKFFAKLIK